ncbi:MAG: hypothetical protein WKG07_16920 [Hymenobacter sp.]
MKRLLLPLLLATVPAAAQQAPALAADTARLRQHSLALTTTPQPRNYEHPVVLDSVAAYVAGTWRRPARG